MYSDIFPARIPPVPVRFEKNQYQNSTGTAAFFFGEYISKFAILLLFCRAAADSIPTLFPILFSTFRLWHLTILWWFLYTDYSTKALCVSRDNIAAHKRAQAVPVARSHLPVRSVLLACGERSPSETRTAADNSVEALRNLKVYRRI